MCAIRLSDKIDIDGMTTSVGCFPSSLGHHMSSVCWLGAWPHKLVSAHDRRNSLVSESVEVSNYGSSGSSYKCDVSDEVLDFTGSPVICMDTINGASYVSGVVWEDTGK